MSNCFDKNTLGNSPASIYLIDLLNSIERKKATYIIKSYSDFKETFRELVDAHADGAIGDRVVRKYMELYRSTLPAKRVSLLDKGYDIKVVNLYDNLIVAEFKKVIRKLDTVKRIETSAVARAKHNLKLKGTVFHNQTVATIGKYEDHEMVVDVKFNQHGIGSSFINTNLIKDTITSETLMQKSLKRMQKRKAK